MYIYIIQCNKNVKKNVKKHVYVYNTSNKNVTEKKVASYRKNSNYVTLQLLFLKSNEITATVTSNLTSLGNSLLLMSYYPTLFKTESLKTAAHFFSLFSLADFKLSSFD